MAPKRQKIHTKLKNMLGQKLQWKRNLKILKIAQNIRLKSVITEKSKNIWSKNVMEDKRQNIKVKK